MGEWVSEWVSGWMDECVREWVSACVRKWVSELLGGWMIEWVGGWLTHWNNAWMTARTNEWMDGWMNDWMQQWWTKKKQTSASFDMTSPHVLTWLSSCLLYLSDSFTPIAIFILFFLQSTTNGRLPFLILSSSRHWLLEDHFPPRAPWRPIKFLHRAITWKSAETRLSRRMCSSKTKTRERTRPLVIYTDCICHSTHPPG